MIRRALLWLADGVPREDYDTQHRGMLDVIASLTRRVAHAESRAERAEEQGITLVLPAYLTDGGDA